MKERDFLETGNHFPFEPNTKLGIIFSFLLRNHSLPVEIDSINQLFKQASDNNRAHILFINKQLEVINPHLVIYNVSYHRQYVLSEKLPELSWQLLPDRQKLIEQNLLDKEKRLGDLATKASLVQVKGNKLNPFLTKRQFSLFWGMVTNYPESLNLLEWVRQVEGKPISDSDYSKYYKNQQPIIISRLRQKISQLDGAAKIVHTNNESKIIFFDH